MKEFFKIIVEALKPYKKFVVLNVSLNILGIIFSLFSLTLIIPFLETLFSNTPAVLHRIPFNFTFDALKNNFYYFINQIASNPKYGKEGALVFVSIFVVSMIFLKNIALYFANFFMSPLRNGVVKDIRNNMFGKILDLPMGYFTEARKGDTISRITGDVGEVEVSVMFSIEMVFREPLTIMLFVVALFIMSFKLSLFIIVLLPVAGLIIGRIGKNLRKDSSLGQQKMGDLISVVEETLSGARIIKAFNAEKIIRNKFYKENQHFYKIANKVTQIRYLASPISEVLGVGVVVLVMWYGGRLILRNDGSMTPQLLIAYLAIFSQIINPAKSFSTAMYAIQKGMASYDRIRQILEVEVNIVEIENPVSINEFKSELEYRNVTFSYAGSEEVLRNVNLKVEKGKMVALVGQSGSGKSTMVDLLPRFYDVTEGEILIDGISIKDYKLKDLRNLMGIVNQESILFNDTIFNNIAFGTNSAKEEDVITAAKVANAHDFIMATEKGYQTNIGDRGSKLSGGQKQRISIARAVLKNPPVLILDEATSALDTESERLVQDALANLMKNRTSVVIAHRLSTIKHADEICVLQNGEIVERGNHDVLIEKNGIYRKLHDLQMF